MIIKNKNKFQLNAKSKILVLGLILIILTGLFSPMVVSARNGLGQAQNFAECMEDWANKPDPKPTQAEATTDCNIRFNSTVTPTTPTTSGKSDFEQQFATAVICKTGTISIDVGGCLVAISYYLFYVVPSWLLALSANFFNAIIAISLSSTLFAKSAFIPTAWAVVRDLSNIFFILILLYIAVKIILDLGGSDAKKMIVKVIIMALLINFSMFFTQVVIDSSNILALIFYNKMDVETKNADGSTRVYTQITKENEKDLSGAMVNAFNPTSQLTWDNFFAAARTPTAADLGTIGDCAIPGTYSRPLNKSACEKWGRWGTWTPNPKYANTPDPSVVNKDKSLTQVPSGIMLGLILVTGAVMLFASYCFFIAGISFVGRLIELWILIIFSPFAFMSYSSPDLGKVGYIGWEDWWKRLLAVAFMAPIFMFFLYFIFMLINAKLFGNLITDNKNMVNTMLLIIIPALIILILLLKATSFAKKGSGVLGEKLLAGAKMVGGLAGGLVLGAATGGAAMALRGTVGRAATNLGESNRFRDWAANTRGGQFISNRVSGLASGSFDARKTAAGGYLAKKSGMNLESSKAIGLGSKEGGFTKSRADRVKRNEEFATKQLDTGDYGKAELTRGGMTANQANRTIAQMQRGGMVMTPVQQFQQHALLTGAGMTVDQATTAARHLDEAKRNDFANRIERRVPGGPAQRRNATKRISANKIRRSAVTATQNAQLARLTAALATAQAAAGGNQPAVPPVVPPAVPPVACWVAEVLYGADDQRTHAARLWAATNNNWFTKLYGEYGKSWAKWLAIHNWAQPIVKPIWDVMAIKGQSLAVKIRNNNSFIKKEFNYLLEKVK